MSQPITGPTPAEGADGPAEPAAAAKIAAAFDLLASAFQDTRIDSATLTKEGLLEQIVASQRVLNTAWAVQSARLAQVGAIEDTFTLDSRDPRGFRDPQVRHTIGVWHNEFIGSEVGPLLGWTSGQAETRVAEATDAITRTPRLFQRVGTGELEPAKLSTIHRALGQVVRELAEDGTPVTHDLARKVESALLSDPEDADADHASTDPDTVDPEVEQRNLDLIARQSAGQLRNRTARVLHSLDPIAAKKAATKRRRDRIGVFAHPDDEAGLSHLHGVLPAETVAKIMAAVDQLAHDLHTDTTTRKTLAECRADALADLILGNASITTKLVIQVPVHIGTGTCSSRWPAAFAHPVTGLPTFPQGRSTGQAPPGTGATRMKSQAHVDREFNELLNRLYPPQADHFTEAELRDDAAWDGARPSGAEIWGEEFRRGAATARPPDGTSPPTAPAAWLGDANVPGIGVIPASVIEAMSRSFGMTITRALIDADTGVTVETCETRYRPSRKLREFVRARDRHCRFPGCTRPARWCDLDHVEAWPGGPTAAYNLHCLCRHHHRAKQENGWSVTMAPHGVCTWTSPTGRIYVTTPAE